MSLKISTTSIQVQQKEVLGKVTLVIQNTETEGAVEKV